MTRPRCVPLRGWLTLHQLYSLAEGQRLTQLQVEDRLSGSGTVTTAYLQALLLGCCKPNTWRQNDLAAAYRGLQEWGGARERGPSPPAGPSSWLVTGTSLVPPGARTLDVACGRGRHALFLAAAGSLVRAVDRDPERVARLNALARRGRPDGPPVLVASCYVLVHFDVFAVLHLEDVDAALDHVAVFIGHRRDGDPALDAGLERLILLPHFTFRLVNAVFESENFFVSLGKNPPDRFAPFPHFVPR